MDRSDARHDAPRWDRGLSSHGCALLCVAESRAELATMLILQELGLSVDLAVDAEAAIDWVRQAHYALIVLGPGREPAPLASYALRLRRAAPTAQIVVLADPETPLDDLDHLAVRVLRPPLDVNALMGGLWRAA